MNNILNFNRLGKLIRFDGVQFSQKLLKSTIIIEAAIFFGTWMFISALQNTLTADERSILFYISVILVPVFTIERLYGDDNDPRKGIHFAMLPASTLEKTISMFLYCCIVMPIVCLILSIIMDTILAALPFGGFDGFMTFGNFQGNDFGKILTSFIFASSIFMLGTVLFKKRQNTKTIACLIGLSIVGITIISIFLNHFIGIATWSFGPNDLKSELIEKWTMPIIWVLIVAIAFFIYQRIKKQKY